MFRLILALSYDGNENIVLYIIEDIAIDENLISKN